MSDKSARDLQLLASLRLEDARILHAQNGFSGAYYLAGYAIECALKAIIAQSFQAAVIPEKRYVDRIFTHDLKALLELSGLRQRFEIDAKGSAELRSAWASVTAWNEASRYEVVDPFRAAEMIEAVGNETYGVLQWLMQRW